MNDSLRVIAAGAIVACLMGCGSTRHSDVGNVPPDVTAEEIRDETKVPPDIRSEWTGRHDAADSDGGNEDTCHPVCAGVDCGPDGCGGSCGECQSGDQCDDGRCVCLSDCTDKGCGPDGCGGECGSCDDNDVCTDDLCDYDKCQYSFNFAPCDDGNPCTGNDKCHAGVCSGAVLPQAELVETGCVCHDDSSCRTLDDGDPCNGTLYCSTEGRNAMCAVVPGSLPDCDDGNPCSLDLCEPYVGCISTPDDSLSCSNSDPCDGEETCDNGECLDGSDLVCDDDDPCTSDSCVPVAGCVHEPDGGFCEDGLDCTTHSCDNGACQTTILPGFCVIDKMCMEPACQNPVNPCQACIPEESQDSWTYLAEGEACAPGKVCYEDKCCTPNCDSLLCGPDGCGGSCGLCQDGWSCQAGGCVEGPCVPDCLGKECGADGCQGNCGNCPTPLVCDEGVCKKIVPYHVWSRRFGGNAQIQGRTITVGGDGSIVIAGRFDADLVDFGCSVVEKQLHNDLFLLKLDSSGTCLWSRAFATGWISYPHVALVIDESGNIYVAGSFSAAVLDIGAPPLSNGGACCEGLLGEPLSECNDAFLARLDSQGQTVWSKGFGGCNSETTVDLELTSDGFLVLRTYATSTSVNYGGSALQATGAGVAQHLSRFDLDGNHIWSISLGLGGWGWYAWGVGGMDCDQSGACLVSGTFSEPVELAGATMIPNGYPGSCVPGSFCFDGYVVKVNKDGNSLWSSSFGGPGWEVFSGVAVGFAGSGAIGGHFRYSDSMVGTQVFPLSNDSDLLVISLGTTGTTDWVVHGTGPQLLQDVVIDADQYGQFYVGSTFAGTLQMGGGEPLEGAGSMAGDTSDVSVFRISETGAIAWGKSFGAEGEEDLDSVAVDEAQSIFLLGGTTSIFVDFDGPALESVAQHRDMTVVKLGQKLICP